MTDRRLVFVLALFLVLDLSGIAQDQSQPATASNAASSPVLDEQTAKDRHYAIELYDQGKYTEALPWFEKVLAAAPNDIVSRERLGGCLVAQAATLSDPAQRKATRVRARQEFLKAKELGDKSDYLQIALAGLPEDGSESPFSSNAEVDRLMKEGDAAFGKADFDGAKNFYLQALMLDPNSYEAMLFLGDVYLRKSDLVAAGEWYSRAVQVDPNREAAYRYWGDSLLQQGKFSAAREKFIAAVICDPYTQRTWSGINKYAQATKEKATWYKIQSPNSFSTNGKGGTINLDANSLDKKDGSSAWIGYPMVRLQWKNELFAKEYPNEKQYRHSLKEESAALSVVASVASELSTGKKAEKLNPDLLALVQLKNAGFIDAYVLLNVPDQGIAQDYVEYRKAHRDVLVRYLNEVVVPAAPADRDAHQ